MIPLSVPNFAGHEWKYLKECLDSGWVSSGEYVDRFEKDICSFTRAKYAVACTNGTAALQVAARICGVSPGDEVIVPTVTFIAPINVVRYLGAEPVFMDCDDFYNIDIEKTIDFIKKQTIFKNGITLNSISRRRISAVIPVHVFGNAVNLDPLIPICKERNIRIVEDATESLGTHYTDGSIRNRYTGTVGDIGCFSFNGNKIITSGGGGMLVTDSDEYEAKARYLINQAKDDSVRYIHNEIGYNFRLTNIQAAIGVAQLEKLPDYIKIKKRNFQDYSNEISKINGLHLANVPDYANTNYWMYALQILSEVYGKDRTGLMLHLEKNGVETRPLWYLNHLQIPFKNCQSHCIEKAYDLCERTLNIPCSVSLSAEEVHQVIRLLK